MDEANERCSFPSALQIMPPDEKPQNMTKGRIYKNLIVVGVACMLFLFSQMPCRELQSSINFKDGLGTYSQTVNGCLSVFSLSFVTPYVNRKLGLKKSMIFSLTVVTVYYLTNFYPSWYTMIPGAIVNGLGWAPIWPAKASYITILSQEMSDTYNTPLDSTVSLLFGVFYGFYYNGYVIGNLASYLILKPDETVHLLPNQTDICGVEFCDWKVKEDDVAFKRPPDWEIYLLFGVFMVISWLAAIIVFFFLDPIEDPNTLISKDESTWFLISKTWRSLFTPKQMLIFPMGFLRGILRTFLAAEFTKAFVTCSWSIHSIGLTIIGFGVVCGIMSLVLGRLVRWTGRLPLFSLAVVVHVIVCVIVVLWKPNTDQLALYFVVPCLLGVSNSIWESQVASIYALVFPNDREVVFAIYGMAEEAGALVSFGYSASLCVQYKLTIFMIMVAVAYICYLVTEFKIIKNLPISGQKQGTH